MEAFIRALERMQLSVSQEACDAVQKWFEFYSGWPGRRVTGHREPEDIAVKLVADSFAAAGVMPSVPSGDALDLGSGSGWPGLAVRLLSPSGQRRKVSLLESRLGACDFMRGFLQYSDLSDVSVVQARAEDAFKDPGLWQRSALVTTRAMAQAGVALELASGFLELGGAAVLWLGPGQESAVDVGAALPALGLVLARKHFYELPAGGGHRHLAIYMKVSAPAPGYPRRLSRIKASPLISQNPGSLAGPVLPIVRDRRECLPL
jgi:16S rRNA (guanine527-N7)-methyltransferase